MCNKPNNRFSRTPPARGGTGTDGVKINTVAKRRESQRRRLQKTPEQQRDLVSPWLRRWHGLTGLYAVFLTLLLWLPNPKVLLWGWEPSDETSGYVHLMTFALLGLMVELGRRKKSRGTWFGILVFYAFFTECVQHYLPIRGFEFRDILQDILGLILGVTAGWAAYRTMGIWTATGLGRET